MRSINNYVRYTFLFCKFLFWPQWGKGITKNDKQSSDARGTGQWHQLIKQL